MRVMFAIFQFYSRLNYMCTTFLGKENGEVSSTQDGTNNDDDDAVEIVSDPQEGSSAKRRKIEEDDDLVMLDDPLD